MLLHDATKLLPVLLGLLPLCLLRFPWQHTWPHPHQPRPPSPSPPWPSASCTCWKLASSRSAFWELCMEGYNTRFTRFQQDGCFLPLRGYWPTPASLLVTLGGNWGVICLKLWCPKPGGIYPKHQCVLNLEVPQTSVCPKPEVSKVS